MAVGADSRGEQAFRICIGTECRRFPLVGGCECANRSGFAPQCPCPSAHCSRGETRGLRVRTQRRREQTLRQAAAADGDTAAVLHAAVHADGDGLLANTAAVAADGNRLRTSGRGAIAVGLAEITERGRTGADRRRTFAQREAAAADCSGIRAFRIGLVTERAAFVAAGDRIRTDRTGVVAEGHRVVAAVAGAVDVEVMAGIADAAASVIQLRHVDRVGVLGAGGDAGDLARQAAVDITDGQGVVAGCNGVGAQRDRTGVHRHRAGTDRDRRRSTPAGEITGGEGSRTARRRAQNPTRPSCRPAPAHRNRRPRCSGPMQRCSVRCRSRRRNPSSRRWRRTLRHRPCCSNRRRYRSCRRPTDSEPTAMPWSATA